MTLPVSEEDTGWASQSIDPIAIGGTTLGGEIPTDVGTNPRGYAIGTRMHGRSHRDRWRDQHGTELGRPVRR